MHVARFVGAAVLVIFLATGCAAFSSAPGSSAARTTVHRARPHHWITVHQGQTRTFAPRAVAYPLTITCPKRPGQTIGSGAKQVIRTPLRRGRSTWFGSGIANPGIDVAVSSNGAMRVSCG